MKIASPLRYPGGKAAMVGLLAAIRKLNSLETFPMAEPFAGGAGASLSLLELRKTPEIFINDADPAIFDFWWTITRRPQPFLAKLEAVDINIEEWSRQREIYRSKNHVSRLRKGFAAFVLNRCNRSGIIGDGGPIGGVDQAGLWKLDARFNRSELRKRIERIVDHGRSIHVSGMDGLKFIGELDSSSVFLFVDPPYYKKGESLYLNALDDAYHTALAARLRSISSSAWVLTYDDCSEVRELYGSWADLRPFSLRYSAARRRMGAEVLITPKWMRLPEEQDSLAITW